MVKVDPRPRPSEDAVSLSRCRSISPFEIHRHKKPPAWRTISCHPFLVRWPKFAWHWDWLLVQCPSKVSDYERLLSGGRVHGMKSHLKVEVSVYGGLQL
jgi:hypothetical protein